MKCSNCGFDNQEGSLYCQACGTLLIKPVTYESDPLNMGNQENTKQFEEPVDQYVNQGDPYGNQYGNQGGRYGDQYGNQYGNQGGQYGDQYGNQYGNQGSQYGNQGGQYGNQYGSQYGNQYGNQGDQYGYTDDMYGYDDDRQWEEERQRRSEQRKANRIAQQKKENKRIIIIGIVVAAIIAAIGIAAFFGVKYFMGNSEQQTSEASGEASIDNPVKNGDNTVTPTPSAAATATPTPTVETPTPTATATPTPTATATPTPTPTVETPTPEPELAAMVGTASSVDFSGYNIVSVSSAAASSTLVQKGAKDENNKTISNSVEMTYDGNAETSWQENASGMGEGEFLSYELSREYQIRYITFKMGNWRNDTLFYENGRPKDITVWIGDEAFEVTIPDGMTEYCLELTKDVAASEVVIQIDSVYTEGTDCEDTCISEVSIYGK